MATVIRLSLSALILGYLSWRLYFDWYPGPYFASDGGWQGFRLIAAVELVLGPALTFLVFDIGKKTRAIVFDMAVIVAIQAGALGYGIYAVYSQRPVAIVLIDEFVVPAIREQYGDRLESLAELAAYSDEHPPIVYSAVPRTRSGIAEMTRIKAEEGVPEHAQMQLYRPREELGPALRAKQLLFVRRLGSGAARDRFDDWLATHGRRADEVLIAPFTGRYGAAWLVFDPDGNYLDHF